MSKKNNKNRKKKYVEMLKEMERDREKTQKDKKERKIANETAKKLEQEIEDLGLDDNENKMDVEKKETFHHKKKGFRKKHGRYC